MSTNELPLVDGRYKSIAVKLAAFCCRVHGRDEWDGDDVPKDVRDEAIKLAHEFKSVERSLAPPAPAADFLGTLPQITDPDTVESLKVAEGMREITPAPAGGLPKLEELTYQVRHSPRCVKPFEVRLVGKGAGTIDGRIYQSRDFIGYGATFDEAAAEAMQLKFAVSSQLDAPPVDSADGK